MLKGRDYGKAIAGMLEILSRDGGAIMHLKPIYA